MSVFLTKPTLIENVEELQEMCENLVDRACHAPRDHLAVVMAGRASQGLPSRYDVLI